MSSRYIVILDTAGRVRSRLILPAGYSAAPALELWETDTLTSKILDWFHDLPPSNA